MTLEEGLALAFGTFGQILGSLASPEALEQKQCLASQMMLLGSFQRALLENRPEAMNELRRELIASLTHMQDCRDNAPNLESK